MIIQMQPLVMNQFDWPTERFFSSEAIAWLEEYVGRIYVNNVFGSVARRRIDGPKSFIDVGKMMMLPELDEFMASLRYKPKPITFEQHIQAKGWRYDRVWEIDLTKNTVDFKSNHPVPVALHEIEIIDDDLAFQFRLGWL